MSDDINGASLSTSHSHSLACARLKVVASRPTPKPKPVKDWIADRGPPPDFDDEPVVAPAPIAVVNGSSNSASIGSQPANVDALRDDTNGDDLAELCAEEFPPVVEHIEGLVADGLTLLAAKPKVGKSWLLLDMGLAVTGGGLAAGSLRATKGRALLLMLEDSRRRLKDRALTLTAGSTVPAGCRVFTRWPRGLEGVAELDRWLSANPAVKFVGIDVLARFRDVQKENGGSSYQADYEAVAMLQELAQKRGVAIVLLHHTRKADSDDPIDLISGTLGIAGGADHLIVVTGNKDAGYKLTSRGRDMPDLSWDLEFDCGRWSVLGNSQPKKRALDRVERIDRDARIRELHERGMSQRDISREIGCSVGTVSNALAASHA